MAPGKPAEQRLRGILMEYYHEVINEKRNILLQLLKREYGEVHGRGFTDSAPAPVRSRAQKRIGMGTKKRNLPISLSKQPGYLNIAY
jgi:epoxyqueuosine reductase